MEKPFAFSVKALVVDDQQRVLVLKRSAASKNNAGKWDLPGGKCDPGESLSDALRREVAEEAGLHVQLRRVVGSTQADLPDRVVAYMILEATPATMAVTISPEHDAFQWYPRELLHKLDVPSQFRKLLGQYAKEAKDTPFRTQAEPYKTHVLRFAEIQETYAKLGKHLEGMLRKICKGLGLAPIVMSRPKSIDSFAEKILRKNYLDPFKQMTDLCGARAIVHTLHDVKALDRYLREHPETFEIFPDDSGDKQEGLAAGEFGYLSHHYVLALTAGSGAPADIVGKKAELQVRTILQHAWADISHELNYKNSFELPRRLKREFARLAAVLEEADRGFDGIRASLNNYAAEYAKLSSPERLDQEMDFQQIVLDIDKDNMGLAQKMAKLAIAREKWDRAAAALQPFASKASAPLLRDLGNSICQANRSKPFEPGFAAGQALLEQAVKQAPGDVDAWSTLAGSWRKKEQKAPDVAVQEECSRRARELYRTAYLLDPGNPYPLGNYIEYEVALHPDVDIASFFAPSLQDASERCRMHIEVGINLPWAYFDLGKFQLLLSKPAMPLGSEALSQYARGASLRNESFYLKSALGSFTTLAPARNRLPGFDWSKRFLELALSLRFAEPCTEPAEYDLSSATPVLILAGGADAPAGASQRDLLLAACKDYRGSIIMLRGATSDPALAADLGRAIAPSGKVFQYAPLDPSPWATPGDVLRYWTDLAVGKTKSEHVKLLCCSGGDLAALESELALALKASVGVVAGAGVEVEDCLAEMPWKENRHLQRLTASVTALRDFLAG